MTMELIKKEDVLTGAERWFSRIIKHIESIEEIDALEKVALMVTYNRGIKDTINLFHETKDRLGYVESPLSIYALGVWESIYMINGMIDDTEQTAERNNVPIGKVSTFFIKIYMKGVQDVADLHRRHKLKKEILKIVEDVNVILSAYEEKEPEDAWEKMRNRIGVNIDF